MLAAIGVKDCSQPTVTVNDITVCQNQCGTINAFGIGGTPPLSYLWSTGATTTAINVCPNPTTNYTVTVTDTKGSTAQAVAVATMEPLPTVTAGNISICVNTSGTLTASSTNSSTDAYIWTPATGLNQTTGSSVTASPTSTTTYTIHVTSLAGCTGSNTVVVTVNPLPIITASNVRFCSGLNATATANPSNLTYSWLPSSSVTPSNAATVSASPANTTTYTITGTDINTCSNTATVVVTVDPLPLITVADVFICNGANATLSASSTNLNTTYTWNTGVNNTSITVQPTTTSIYSVNGVDGNGCIGSTIGIVTVNPIPVISLRDTTICINTIAPLTASGADNYIWSPATGLSATIGDNVDASPLVTTTYTVVGTSNAGCSSSNTVVVTVNPLPIITASDEHFCKGLSVPVTANPSTLTYSWAPGTSVTPNNTPSVTASPQITTTYTITGTDVNTCSNTTTVVVTVDPLPTIIVANQSICEGGSTSLTATGALNYAWNTGDLASSITVTPASTTTYTVVGSDALGCIGDTTAVVTVNRIPTIVTTPITICENTSKPLSASGTDNYVWSPAIGLSTTTGPTVVARPTITSTYTVVGTSNAGCSSSTTAVVTVDPAPIITSTPASMCPGEDTVLTANGGVSYTWAPSGSLNSSTGTSVIARPLTSTTYTIVGTGANSCTGQTTVNVTIYPQPVAAFVSSPKDADLFNPTISFYDQSVGGIINSWQWSLGDVANSSSNNKNTVFTYPEIISNYDVQLIVTNQDGCIDSVTNTVRIRGIFTFYVPNTFTPNNDSNNDGFTPKGEGIDPNHYDLWIFDRWGNLIWHTDIWGDKWDGKANKGADVAQIDTYVWKVRVRELETGIKHNYIGHVNIVR
jgi:gliding motility-associated-like protein